MPWRAVFNSDTPAAMGRRKGTSKLSWDEIGFFSHSLTAARGQYTLATKGLCAEFGLGPRGPWIIGLIGRHSPAPHELADFYKVGRSLITAELNKLAKAGLIVQEKDEKDGRRITLTLTPTGRKVRERLGEVLDAFLAERLSGYSHDEIMLCARMLSDFARGA